MLIKELGTKKWHHAIVELVTPKDYKRITKKLYFFDWKKEKNHTVYKLRRVDSEDILGLVSIEVNEEEEWISIQLLAVSKENRGTKGKIYSGIAGNLIAFIGREAIKLFNYKACIALEPKTELETHYIKKYGMIKAGKRLALFGKELIDLLEKYKL